MIADSAYPFTFEAEIERFGVGRVRKVWYNVLFLPDTLATRLPFASHSRLRIEGEIADVPIANAFMPAGDGRHYVIVAPMSYGMAAWPWASESPCAFGSPIRTRLMCRTRFRRCLPMIRTSCPPGSDSRPASSARWRSMSLRRREIRRAHGELKKHSTLFGGDLRAWRTSRRSLQASDEQTCRAETRAWITAR